ncbi:MAG: glycosyltransferase family 39 protein [Prevotellaceae bacterium]|jgi:4-amino-4-deoxy-L-arabinose transferase-like glycosyltransferase|nr:glycosyltransferase family 39 protein [Prevotellaceae bacterium]
MENKKLIIIQLLIVVAGAVLFMPGLGVVHLFDWDEINFAESAREMILTRDYLTVQINFEPFWEKPPLFAWLQVGSMQIFGINEFGARFPNAVCGIITLLVLFNIGRKLRNVRFGLIWTLIYACSVFPFFFFKTGIIDPWFNLFIFLGTYFFICFTQTENVKKTYLQVALSALFLGLAVLTKGPVGFLIFALTFFVYLIIKKIEDKRRKTKDETQQIIKSTLNWKQVVLFFIVLAFVGGFWFVLQIINGNFTIFQDFILYQIRLFQTKDAGHGGFFLYHFVMVLIGVSPASILALPTFRRSILKDESNEKMRNFFQWQIILFWVVMILFTIVKTKIVHYSSMSYFPLTFMAAWYVEQIFDGKKTLAKWVKIPMATISIIVGIAAAAIPFFDKFKHFIMPYADEFTRGNLQATSSWLGFEWLTGVILVAGVVLFVVFSNKKEYKKAFIYLLSSSLIFVSAAMFFITPQVEKYSQLSVIEFYEDRQNEDCYILSTFKSYAPYFYAQQKPENKCTDREFLQRGDLDKPCYFVLRNTTKNVEFFTNNVPDAIKLYDKNGFAFYVRQPKMKE